MLLRLIRIALKTGIIVTHFAAKRMIDRIFGGGEAAWSHGVVGVDSLGALKLVGWWRGGVHAVGW